ncbi:Ankyrin repeat domain-containing protein [Entamoeba marina]
MSLTPNTNTPDNFGIYPLHYAVHNKDIQKVCYLLEHGADPTTKNIGGWSVLHEAIASQDKTIIEMITKAIQKKEKEMFCFKTPIIISTLSNTSDFQIQIHWKFKSWVPLIELLLPNDTTFIYKRGLKIRIDTNLIGFEGTTPIWQNSTILFHGDGKRKGQLIVLNNDDKTYHIVSSLKTFDVQKLLKQHEIKTHISTTKLQCKETGEIVEKYGFTCHEYIINDIPWLTKKRIRNTNGNSVDCHSISNGLLYEDEQIISKQKVVSSRFLMARNHPINLTTFINLLQLVSGTDHYNKLIKFSKNVLTDSMGFPISISIPVKHSIEALIKISDYKQIHPKQELFKIPNNYEEQN